MSIFYPELIDLLIGSFNFQFQIQTQLSVSLYRFDKYNNT